MNSTADGLADLGGCRSPGGWKVVGGLKRITEGIVIKRRGLQESELYNRVITPFLGVVFHCAQGFFKRLQLLLPTELTMCTVKRKKKQAVGVTEICGVELNTKQQDA